jgi:hypothetical protein
VEKRNYSTRIFISVFILIVAVPLVYGEGGGPDITPVADVSYGGLGLTFMPKVMSYGLILNISYPDGTVHSRTFESGRVIHHALTGNVLDGLYTYELRVVGRKPQRDRESAERKGSGFSLEREPIQNDLSQTGYFRVEGGRIINTDTPQVEPRTGTADQPGDILHNDDVIITFSLCVGNDCVNGESFGFDTIRLKENNLRLKFQDTSSSASFPTNDWMIEVNSSANGGASYFSVMDVDAARYPFKIEAGAIDSALYVDDSGRVGLGTSTPYEELHVWRGDTPGIRLEQSGGGWAPQTWDVCGNEANFFIRDVTNGSELSFRIQPGTPGDTLCLKNNGNVGIGTWTPSQILEVQEYGKDAILLVNRSDGAQAQIGARENKTLIGSRSNHTLAFIVDNNWKFRIRTNDLIETSTGASCTTGGVWTDASSREYKENILSLDADRALKALRSLDPVTYNYKRDKGEKYVGFIAEDVPELVAMKDRKGLSPMDITAVLTKVVQEQQKSIELQKKAIEQQQKTIDLQQKYLEKLEQKIAALEKNR